MIYNYERIVEELECNGIEIVETKASLKYARGYHRYEKCIFGRIRVRPLIEIKKIFNFFPVWISRKSALNEVERILASRIGLPHSKRKGVLFYWIPFRFNGHSSGIEIITVRE